MDNNSFEYTIPARKSDYIHLTIDPDSPEDCDEYTMKITRSGSYKTNDPSISIQNPSGTEQVTGITTISASATDDSGIAFVEFFMNDVLCKKDTTLQYTYE